MSLETIRKIAEGLGNEGLTKAVLSLQDTNKSNVDRIYNLEKDLNKAIEKRDRQSQLVKKTFGVDEISEDSLKSVLDGNGSFDKALKAENDKLLGITKSLTEEKDNILRDYQNTKNKYKIEKSLISLGGTNDSANQKAYDILLNEVSKGASFDDNGNIVFKSNDGTTVRNIDGSPMTLGDRYNSIKQSDDFKFLFKPSVSKKGSGTNGSSSSKSSTGKLGGSKEEQLAYIKQKFNL